MSQAFAALAQMPAGRNGTDVRSLGGQLTFSSDRRRLLGGITMTGAAFVCGPAMAAEVFRDDALHCQDAIFWERHAQWQAVEALWSADLDNSDANYDRWNDQLTDAHYEMMVAPATTAAALLAKFESVDWDPGAYEWDNGVKPRDLLIRDIKGALA